MEVGGVGGEEIVYHGGANGRRRLHAAQGLPHCARISELE